MANMPSNPNMASHKASATDTSIVHSVCGGGTMYASSSPQTVQVSANSHPIASRGDGALWDVTAGAYVSIQNTNIGTTAVPKNGQ